MINFLLQTMRNEKEILQDLSFFFEKDVNTGEEKWCLAGPEYSINPFGKLVKSPQIQQINKKNGKVSIIQHKKYHYGFFINLNCSKEFYNHNKDMLDKYILTEERKKELNINPETIPAWF